jgi:hypothetical protein
MIFTTSGGFNSLFLDGLNAVLLYTRLAICFGARTFGAKDVVEKENRLEQEFQY